MSKAELRLGAWLDPLAAAYRRWGYLAADLDSLGRLAPTVHADLAEATEAAGSGESNRASDLRERYCGSLGVEFAHMIRRDRAEWIAARMEEPTVDGPDPGDAEHILFRLMGAERFELFLQKRYVGSKRYSIEGAAALIPLLDATLDTAIEHGGEIAVLGMSHRGRLSVLFRTVGVSGPALFTGFEDVDPKSVLGSGDVKYHLGATGTHFGPGGKSIDVRLVSNPSHLEAVNPVLMGRVRARQQRLEDDPRHRVVPICLHGDAAFAGQGVTAETLNLAELDGYEVGGTVHVIVNNLIGFTAQPRDLHSSRFSSDLAKRLDAPIFHVDGEDPDAVVRAGRLAMAYRATFGSDVFVDLICFRRHGHSEVEDPTTTSPQLYGKIAERPMLYELYAQRKQIDPERKRALEQQVDESLQLEQAKGREATARPVLRRMPAHWESYQGGRYDPELEVPTGIDAPTLEAVGAAYERPPSGFTIHPKLAKLLTQRSEMARGERPIDFGAAEAFAFGSLLQSGMPIRLSGQDSRRGTFNHRHAALYDRETGEPWLPLASLGDSPRAFQVVDSPLSEAAVLGYEYGFSRDYPDALVLWEAQFGDFANGAQVFLDQFLAAGEDKWQLLSGLVVLLPHGYEGQGPEHSSARLERFLELAAESNLQICQPSTAGQYFHLLRRQALRPWRKPLIVMMPKGLLRAPAAACDREELLHGSFQRVLTEPELEDCTRLLLCSGKVAHDLRKERERRGDDSTTVIRLAELYPFPEEELHAELNRHPRARKILWVQEEPANMGALNYMRPRLAPLVGDRHVTSVKRSESASPATGSPKAHALEQETLLRLAFS